MNYSQNCNSLRVIESIAYLKTTGVAKAESYVHDNIANLLDYSQNCNSLRIIESIAYLKTPGVEMTNLNVTRLDK